MAADDSSSPSSSPASGGPPPSSNQQFALAMELPIILVSAVAVGGFLGWLLDRWLHTAPYLLVVLGALGFYAGLREMLRRLQTRVNRGKPPASNT